MTLPTPLEVLHMNEKDYTTPLNEGEVQHWFVVYIRESGQVSILRSKLLSPCRSWRLNPTLSTVLNAP